MLEAISKAGLVLPKRYPEEWAVDCKSVGSAAKALTYLGRYLYRGMIQEKDIIACNDGKVTYRFQNSTTKKPDIGLDARKTAVGVLLLRCNHAGHRNSDSASVHDQPEAATHMSIDWKL